MKKSLFIIGLLLLGFASGVLEAQTNVGGVVSSNTTWTIAGSPYIIISNTLVDSGFVLTIEPGAMVKFKRGTCLQINGTLVARGTADEKIIFTSDANVPTRGDWGYIYFSNASMDAVYDSSGNYISGSILEYVVVEYGGGAMVDNNGAIRLENAHPFINHSEIKNNAMIGITGWLLSGDLRITNNIICNNGTTTYNAGGIYVDDWWQGAVVTIENNTIRNNIGGLSGGIYAFIFKNAIIRRNIIESNSSGQGGGGIYFDGNGVIENNIINNNISEAEGAGISLLGTSSPTQPNHVIIKNNLIIGNKSLGINGRGAGMFIEPAKPGTINILNNIFADNVSNDKIYGGGGLYILPGYALGTSIVIEENSFIGNIAAVAAAGQFSATDKEIMHNTFTGNISNDTSGTNTIKISYTPLFNYNNIFANKAAYILKNDNPQTSSDINGKFNWWGSAVKNDIASMIYDWYDDGTLGIVNYDPFLAEPDTIAPISPPANVKKTDLGGGNIKLMWDANPEPDLAGYKIYYGLPTGFSFSNVVDVGNVNAYVLSGASISDTIAVTAYDAQMDGVNDQFEGHESWFTNAVDTSATNVVIQNDNEVPKGYELKQNYPNPFNPITRISFTIPKYLFVELKIYDMLGNVVAVLVNENKQAGNYDIEFNARNFSSGTYFCKIKAGSFNKTIKLILLK